jgi:hypothetical protein
MMRKMGLDGEEEEDDEEGGGRIMIRKMWRMGMMERMIRKMKSREKRERMIRKTRIIRKQEMMKRMDWGDKEEDDQRDEEEHD